MFSHSRSQSSQLIQKKDTKLIKIAVYSTFFTAFCVVLCRCIAYIITPSITIEAALFDAIQDCIASCLNAFLVLRSIKPADQKYPFGYGKVEACAAFLQALFLFCIGSFLIWKSITSLSDAHHDVTYDQTTILVLCISLILTMILACIQTFVGKRTKSLAILADSAHYKSDIALNLGIIFCLFISFQSAWFDIVVGFIIASYLLMTSIKTGIPAIRILLDRSLPASSIEAIQGIILNEGGIIHSIKTHSLGRGEFIVIELHYKEQTTARSIKAQEDKIEKKIHEQFPRAYIIFSVAHHLTEEITA